MRCNAVFTLVLFVVLMSVGSIAGATEPVEPPADAGILQLDPSPLDNSWYFKDFCPYFGHGDSRLVVEDVDGDGRAEIFSGLVTDEYLGVTESLAGPGTYTTVSLTRLCPGCHVISMIVDDIFGDDRKEIMAGGDNPLTTAERTTFWIYDSADLENLTLMTFADIFPYNWHVHFGFPSPSAEYPWIWSSDDATTEVVDTFDMQVMDRLFYGSHYDMEVGNVEGDSHVEIVYGEGQVVYYDSVAEILRYEFPWTSEKKLALVDLDEDPYLEIVAGSFSGGMRAFNSGDPTAFHIWPDMWYPLGVQDVVGDENPEIVAVAGFDGDYSVTLIDSQTLDIVWANDPPPTAVVAEFGDTDGDGEIEMVSGFDGKISVTDVASGTVEWESEPLVDPPFNRVAVGDLGNNGSLELVFSSETGIGLDDIAGSWLFVLDASTHEEHLRTQVPLVVNGRLEIKEIELGDTDGDNKPEITLLGRNSLDETVIVVLDGETFATEIEYVVSTSGMWSALRIADIDGDTELEFVAKGPSADFAADPTYRIWVLDLATGAVEWESPAYVGLIKALDVGQVDDDPALEIIGAEDTDETPPQNNDIIHIIDGQSYTTQWSAEQQFAYLGVTAYDLDQNGSPEEILFGTSNGDIQAFTPEISGPVFIERFRFHVHAWGVHAIRPYQLTGGEVRLAIIGGNQLVGVNPWNETIQWTVENLKIGYQTDETIATASIPTDTGTMFVVGTKGTVYQYGGVVSRGKIVLDDSSHTVDESAGSVIVSVGRLDSTQGTISAVYATADGSGTAGADYLSATGAVFWADGDNNPKAITIPILEDGIPELAETFFVNLTEVAGGILGRPSQARVTIVDNDSSVVDFVETTATVDESGGSVTLDVARTVDISEAGSIDWATADGTAVAGADYTAASGTLSWASGDGDPQTIQVDMLDDALYEENERFSVVLSNPGGNAVIGEAGTATVTVTSDDVIDIAFTSAAYAAGEGDGLATITVGRTGASNGEVTIDVATSDGTATAGSDYTAAGGTLTWTDGDTADKTFDVPLIDDSLVEPVETVALALSNPSGGATVGSQGTAELGIGDNDGTLLRFTTTSFETVEDDGSVEITLERFGYDTAGAVGVTVTSTDGTATAGQDYQAVSETVSWADGDTADKTLTVTLHDDGLLEGSEDFQLDLSDPTGNAELDSPVSTVVDIADDDLEESPVNTETAQPQTRPDAAMSPDGRAVIVWESYLQDGDGWGIFAQRFDATGLPVGAEFQANAGSSGNQRYPAAAMRSDGGFTVVWMGSDADGDGIIGRRFNANGTPLSGDQVINPTIADDQGEPDVAVDGTGAGLVVWQTDHTGDLEIRGRRLDAAGIPAGSELVLNATSADDQQLPAAAGSAAGGFVVAWQSHGQDGPAQGIVIRRFASSGSPVSGEVIANDFTSGDQLDPAVGVIGDGSFVVAWEDPNNRDGSGSSIQARWFDQSATPLGGDIQVNTYTTGDQIAPEVACAEPANAVILWQSDGQDGSNWGIYGQPLKANGDPIGPELLFNTYTTSAQHAPVVARSDAGTFWAAWASTGQDGSGDGVYGLFGEAWVVTEIFADGFESGNTGAWGGTTR